MILKWLVPVATGLAIFSPWAAGAEAQPAAASPAKKVLVIGIDGCRFDALRAASVPHLDGLIDQGAVAEPIRIFPARFREADTISGPAGRTSCAASGPTSIG